MSVRGSTRVAGIIGDPVRHSLSPAIHNAAFAAVEADWVYVAFPCPPGRGRAAVEAMRDLGIDGLSVTMPHKEAASEACDEMSEQAARLRSVNTVRREADGTLRGESTDGVGFIRSLADAGVDASGRRALVLGAGGAARAVLVSLADAGAEVAVTARRLDAADAAASLVAGCRTVVWADRADATAEVDLLVNATPIGMSGEETPLDARAITSGHVVADLIYVPERTPLLAAAEAAGALGVGGLGMLVHQAAAAFTFWTGVEAPLATMRQAAADGLREQRKTAAT